MNKAIFFDRDGTLVEDIGFVHKIEDFKLMDNVLDGLKLLKGYKLFIVTNQAGVGLGKFSLEDLKKFNEHLLYVLRTNSIKIEKLFYCPHTRENNCECRKPNFKFLKDAEGKFGIDLKKSFVIGDKQSDIEMGRNAGCKTVLVLTGHGLQHRDMECDHVAKDLLDAAQWVLEQ